MESGERLRGWFSLNFLDVSCGDVYYVELWPLLLYLEAIGM